MSWLLRAFSISSIDSGSYYTILDPLEFYEWRYTGLAPKNFVFSDKLPPSDIISNNKIIASAKISAENLKKTDSHHFITRGNVPVEVILIAGYMPSPKELIDRYRENVGVFNRGLDQFKNEIVLKKYITSYDETPHLFKVSIIDEEKAFLSNFGPVKDLVKKFSEIREALSIDSMNKKGKSYELEEFTRYDTAMNYINNSHLYVDSLKMDRLLQTSSIKPISVSDSSWKDLYLFVSKGAKVLNDIVLQYNSKNWFKDSISHF